MQQNAEALAGIAFTQMVRKGAPVGYGGFTSNVDMKSGAPAFGTPEYMKAQLVGGQLARRYNIPYRTSNTCAANTVDAQAAYESVFSLWGAIQGGGNFIMHGAGWLEGGLRCSYEKTILDIDLLQMVAEFLTPLDLSDDALGVDAIRAVGPGGHFFGTQHTQDRYKTAFYSPIISDWRNFETWARPARRRRSKRPTGLEGAAGTYESPTWTRPSARSSTPSSTSAGRRRRADGFLTLLMPVAPTPSRRSLPIDVRARSADLCAGGSWREQRRSSCAARIGATQRSRQGPGRLAWLDRAIAAVA